MMMAILLLSVVLVPLALAVIFVPLMLGARANRAALQAFQYVVRDVDGTPVAIEDVLIAELVRAA
jgi:hypothetical protein